MALTDEQIQEALKSDKIKTAIEAAVSDAVDGLKKKNNELLGELKDVKKRFSDIETEKEELEAKAADKSGDIEKIKEQLMKTANKEKETLKTQLDAIQSQLERKVIGEGLTNALVKAKVKPEHMEAVAALIKAKHKGEIDATTGEPIAKFDGKAVDEFVTAWAQSETGKAFVLANANSGGGSNGANGNGGAGTGATGKKTMTRTEFDGLSIADKSKTAREGVVLTD